MEAIALAYRAVANMQKLKLYFKFPELWVC